MTLTLHPPELFIPVYYLTEKHGEHAGIEFIIPAEEQTAESDDDAFKIGWGTVIPWGALCHFSFSRVLACGPHVRGQKLDLAHQTFSLAPYYPTICVLVDREAALHGETIFLRHEETTTNERTGQGHPAEAPQEGGREEE